jgi:hypothetical protein
MTINYVRDAYLDSAFSITVTAANRTWCSHCGIHDGDDDLLIRKTLELFPWKRFHHDRVHITRNMKRKPHK